MEEKKSKVKLDKRKDENGKNIYSFDLKKLSNSNKNINSSNKNNKDKIRVYAFEIPIPKGEFSLDNYDSFDDIIDELDLDDEYKSNLKEELLEITNKTIKEDILEEDNNKEEEDDSLESLIKKLAKTLNETNDKLSLEDKAKLKEYLNNKKAKLNDDLDLNDNPTNKKNKKDK